MIGSIFQVVEETQVLMRKIVKQVGFIKILIFVQIQLRISYLLCISYLPCFYSARGDLRRGEHARLCRRLLERDRLLKGSLLQW